MLKSFNEFNEIKKTNNIIDDDGHLKDLSDETVIEKLNSFVGAIGVREYLNPEAAVNELKQKLMRIGLHFEDVKFGDDKGSVSMPLIMHGGKFGKADDSAIDEFMDEKESGRSIEFVYEKLPTGTHKVFAKIV
tara:strand:- start:134 stop:532 length:399 start_codon:yes stop_codon:yes gene_type:complete